MSEEWLVRSERPPGTVDVLEAALAADPGGEVDTGAEVGTVVLLGSDGEVVRVRSAGEAHDGFEALRLLAGAPGRADLTAWTEVVGADGSRFAAAVARGLAARLRGHADRRSTGTLPLPEREPTSERPVVDVETASTVGHVSTARIVYLGPAVVAAFDRARATQRRFVLVTPGDSVLTQACSAFVTRLGGWVAVEDDGTARDGYTGQRLTWDDAVQGWRGPTGDDVHPAFAPAEGDRATVEVVAETVHAYGESTRVGVLAGAVVAAAGWRAPTACGVHEPLGHAWDVGLLTAVAKEVSPEPAALLGAGIDADLVLEVVPQPPGLQERVRAVGAVEEPWTAEALLDLARAVLAAGAQVAMVGYRTAVASRHRPARLTEPTWPAVTVVARSRLPGVDDARLRDLLGPGTTFLQHPVPAVVVVDADARPRPGSETAALRQLQLHRLLAEHDPVTRATRAAGAEGPPAAR